MMLLLLLACGSPEPPPLVTYTEDREPCADRTARRMALYGDLHVHAGMSFDARNYGSTLTPEQVLAFAAGQPVTLTPDSNPRTVQLDRPLDFLSLTEHGDLMGEVLHCITPGSPGYDSDVCDSYQGGDPDAALDFGVLLASADPTRMAELCGEDGTGCDAAAASQWQALTQATSQAYDRTADCQLTAFAGYEYTNTFGVSNLHRNVIFRNDTVPERPIGVFEAPTPLDLWQQLDAACPGGGMGACDVLVLPHNSNLSNGRLFTPDYGEAATVDDEAAVAALRARMEPAVEIFQHKGDSECRNGLGRPDDPQCEFEKLRPADDPVCADGEVGSGGMRLWGCVHPLDFVRNVFAEGLQEEARLGVNPYRLGVIGSTDTHNGTPGLVRSTDFAGHVGIVDSTPIDRLTGGTATHDTLIYNPGGLAGVWAVENSRDAIFEAIRRRETFATSGPRIPVRLFVGFGLDPDACDAVDPVFVGDTQGVPMGGTLLPPIDGPLRVMVQAQADPGSDAWPGVGLERIQLVRLRLLDGGEVEEEVIDLVEADTPGILDADTCEAGGGDATMCLVWEDEAFEATVPTLWYARVLEVPTCRWSQRDCTELPADERPAVCTDGSVPATVQQRAWTSPAWWPGG